MPARKRPGQPTVHGPDDDSEVAISPALRLGLRVAALIAQAGGRGPRRAPLMQESRDPGARRAAAGPQRRGRPGLVHRRRGSATLALSESGSARRAAPERRSEPDSQRSRKAGGRASFAPMSVRARSGTVVPSDAFHTQVRAGQAAHRHRPGGRAVGAARCRSAPAEADPCDRFCDVLSWILNCRIQCCSLRLCSKTSLRT